MRSCIEKSVLKLTLKKQKTDSYFNNHEPLDKAGAKFVTIDSHTFKPDGYNLPSWNYVKKNFMEHFAEVQSEIQIKFHEIKVANQFSMSEHLSTSTQN